MKIQIRRAKLEDIKEIKILTKKLLHYNYKNFDKTINVNWTAQYTKEIKDAIKKTNSIALIALDKEKVVGYFIGRIEQAESYKNIKKIAEAQEAYITKNYRRKNIGTLFLKEFFKWAKSKKVKRARAVISSGNKKSINWNKRNGFKDYDVVLERDLN